MKQRITNNNKNENMKMKKTLITALVLGACVSTPLFAQTVVKQDTITMSLTGAKQLSVSTSASVQNAGKWSAGPMFYKTTPIKVTDQDVIKFIGMSLWKNANHYSKKAKLVLVQGELSGFFNITPDLALSMPDDDGIALDPYFSESPGFSADGDVNTSLANSFDSTTFQLANGRHWDVNPLVPTMYPVGHLQPWGQIYIQDTESTDDNVTFYFAISVEECYDCFYLNSFISTATFKTVNTAPNGPPCCVGESVIIGSGKDAYYMTFSFDNTKNNPYLYDSVDNPLYIGDEIGIANTGGGNVVGVPGFISGDAIVPDTIFNNIVFAAAIANGDTVAQAQLAAYIDTIKGAVPGAVPSPYQARFTLNGVLTYTWKLGYIDKTDLSPDFMGTGSYVANGYGFIGLYCSLFNTATVTFKEAAVKVGTAVTGEDWTASWIGIGAEYVVDETNGETTPYANWVAYGSPTYVWGLGESFAFGFGYPTPINVTTSLSYHENFNHAYPAHNNNPGWAAWPTPGWVKSWYW
jgi:hypothetical protein